MYFDTVGFMENSGLSFSTKERQAVCIMANNLEGGGNGAAFFDGERRIVRALEAKGIATILSDEHSQALGKRVMFAKLIIKE